jgi:CheY-like chemotaxis protein
VREAFDASAARGRVLLVEDNPINQKVALGFLAHLGWEADVANDGLEALDIVGHGNYSIILMDCQMPRMDGYEATGRIRAMQRNGSRVPIIALTAGAMPGDRERCLEAGMDDYLSKPIDVSRLDALMRQWARPVESAVVEVEGLDEAITAQLREIRSGTGSILDEALNQFVIDAPARLDEVLSLADRSDWVGMSRAAHSLKGMSAAVGARRLADAADAVQLAGHTDSPDHRVVAELLERLRSALDWALEAARREAQAVLR